MLKGILDKLFQTNEKKQAVKPISQEEVEALVDARFKEHTAALEKTIAEQNITNQGTTEQEDYALTPKQIEFALSLIEKTLEFELATDSANLKATDLNKLIAYNRYKNKGILINLVKKGVLKRKS